jgi:hypothetical protein
MANEPPVRMSEDEARARGKRNLAIALGLVGFVLLVFFVTLAQLRAGSLAPPG